MIKIGWSSLLLFMMSSINGFGVLPRAAAFNGLSVLEVHNITNEPEKIQLKYPVILVHGIALHDRQSPIDFWGRIPQALRDKDLKVYFGNTDAWGGYESNAALLKDTIDRVLEENQTDRVNIIAHSKGGIDARYLIWYYDYGDKVASLTTVCTPHQGAELADLVYGQRFTHTAMSKRGLDVFGRLYGDQNPDMYALLYQLTTEHMRGFNEQVLRDDRVYYQSIYASMNTSLDEMLFFFTHRYILTAGGKNDGLVSEASAQWGPNRKRIDGNLSHMDMVDMKKEMKRGYDIPGMYLGFIRDLGRLGF
jgi:triacylglycerol lipase